jgi:hypothetical protein
VNLAIAGVALSLLAPGCREQVAQRETDGATDAERIVRVVSSAEPQRGSTECLGFIYSQEWVITAKHCVARASGAKVVTLSGVEALVIAQKLHPSADVCMLRVPALGSFEPARIAPAVEPALVVTKLDRELGMSLRHGPATPYRVLPDRIRLRSELRPCRGDSGGPLLGANGSIVGVLSRGSVTCDGRDEFVLLDPISDWVVASQTER